MNGLEARICSFECTFCGGGFAPRPVRPAQNWKAWKGGNFLGAYPAGTAIKHRPADRAAHQRFAAEVGQAAFDQR